MALKEIYKLTKEFAWFLGFLLTDGSIIKPAYRSKGDETHIQFCIHIKDEEALHKIKDILNTRAVVKTYPGYASPQAKLCIYDRKDIVSEYSNIKTQIPETITGFERHFIRGLIDGDGCLYKRKNRNEFMISFIDEYENIVDWVNQTISTTFNIPLKPIRYIKHDHIYELRYSSKEARLVAWWLYHGDTDHCSLQRKLDYYRHFVLEDLPFNDDDFELLYAIQASINEDSIIPNVNASKTLEWCHRLQNILKTKCTPVCSNKGKTKYYYLHVIKST